MIQILHQQLPTVYLRDMRSRPSLSPPVSLLLPPVPYEFPYHSSLEYKYVCSLLLLRLFFSSFFFLPSLVIMTTSTHPPNQVKSTAFKATTSPVPTSTPLAPASTPPTNFEWPYITPDSPFEYFTIIIWEGAEVTGTVTFMWIRMIACDCRWVWWIWCAYHWSMGPR